MNETNSDTNEVIAIELINYDKLISNRDLLLGMPIRLKYDEDSKYLFIQDLGNWGIIELDDSSNFVKKFGSRGSGPGELQELSDFFITKNNLFIVDAVQYVIHKYRRHDGQHISSLNYGNFLSEIEVSSDNKILLPRKPSLIDNNNQPFVTLNEKILLPSLANGEFLFQLINWNGDKLTGIGEISTECKTTEDYDKIRMALTNREVPARDACLVFPVNDPTNLDEIFLVYSAIPKIAKYSLSGQKIWEQTIPRTPEVDSLMTDLSNIVNSRTNHHNSLFPVRKYIAGRSGPEGELYLFTYTNLHTPIILRPMWMHKFDSQGNLMNRYKI
ncbi:MAG: 6-bladed beta-propeller, partial [Candidatus Paceibacterota bacterium]